MQITISLLVSALIGIVLVTVSSCGPESGSLKEAANRRNSALTENLNALSK